MFDACSSVADTHSDRRPDGHRAMPTYLVKVSYTEEGTRSVLEDGATKRREKLREYTEELGGTLKDLYYALGEHDAYAIVEFPDKTSMAAATMLTKASGGGVCSATVLLTPEEIDQATELAERFE